MGVMIEADPELRAEMGIDKPREMKADPRRFRSGSGIASRGVGSGIEF